MSEDWPEAAGSARGTDNQTDGAKSPVRAVWAIGFLLVLAVVFFSLGTWQVYRRAWKLDLIQRVETRIHAAPSAPPGPNAWPGVTAASDEYRHVTVTGRFIPDREALSLAVTELGGGFWVMAPFRTDAGYVVLVNRGYVPPEKKDPASRGAALTDAETRVTGLLRISEPKGGFLRSNDPAAGRWYSRDVAEMAKTFGLSDVAPYFIDAEAGVPNTYPVGGLTVVRFPNSHLVYALTWFSLCAMALGAAVLVWRRRVR